MRYTVYNKAMKRPVFQTNNLEEAIDYTRRHPRKSRRHCIYCHKQRTAERLGFAIAHKRWWQRLGSDLVHLHMERLQQSDCKTCLFINTSKTHRVLHPVRFIFLRQVLFFLYQKFLVCHRICSVVLCREVFLNKSISVLIYVYLINRLNLYNIAIDQRTN